MEVLRGSLLTQETTLRALVDSADCRFKAFDGCFDEIVNQLDALAIGNNSDRNDVGGDQEMILLKANLSTGLYLHITVDNPSTVMIQRKRKTSCLTIISP